MEVDGRRQVYQLKVDKVQKDAMKVQLDMSKRATETSFNSIDLASSSHANSASALSFPPV